jgi:hypothetical protein
MSMLPGMRNVELLPAFATAFAVEIAHLRWIVLKQWKCKCCGTSHIECATKPAWVKILL